jgi:hypothetical protein
MLSWEHKQMREFTEVEVPGLVMSQGRHAKVPLSPESGLCITERAAAHSLQFGTYALWAAGLLAALAVRPVPLCIVSIPRGVNDQAFKDVGTGQTVCRCFQSVLTPRIDHQHPGRAGRTALEFCFSHEKRAF